MKELEKLVLRAQSGDVGAYTAIVDRFQDMAVGYARACLRDHHQAEDVAQEAFLQAYRDLQALKSPAAFPGWFRKIVYKHCDRLLRKPAFDFVGTEEVATRENDPAQDLVERETWSRLESALSGLTVQERQVIHLYYTGDYDRKTIATFLDVPVSTVDNRLRSARHKVKERMSDVQTLRDTAPSNDDRFVQQVRRNIETTWSWYDRAYEYGRGDRRDERQQDALRIAEQATTQYDIEVDELALIRNSIVIGGPMAFRLTSGDQRFALHVYNPSPIGVENPLDSLTGIRDRSDVLEFGLKWFDALAQDTDLTVQQPIANREGSLITQVDVEGQGVNCALLDWVEGDEVSGYHPDNVGRPVSDLRNLGVMLARMHRHAGDWTLPEGFVLPRMDRTRMQTALEVVRWAAEQDRLPTSDVPVLENAVQRIDGVMDDLGESRPVWGPIHTLMPGNAVFTDDAACPIDYNSYAFGYYLFDIAWSFIWNGPADRRRAFLEGYQSVLALPDNYASLIEAFHVAARIVFLAHYAQNPGEDLKGERKFIDLECASYLRDESFLFEKGSWSEERYW